MYVLMVRMRWAPSRTMAHCARPDVRDRPATVASATQVHLSNYGSFRKRVQARSRRYNTSWASLANIPTGETRLRSS
jgi:hypothetical protein